MNPEAVITAENLAKAYRIWSEPAQRLLSPLYAAAAPYFPGGLSTGLRRKATAGYRDFFALQGVSFEVRRGEAVGIIGRNGAGKSTLLQLIAGTLQPSSGSVRVHGRVAALLELGAGFNVDFTGRENVFLSGAVLGLTHKEMEARFAEVAAFAEIGDFMEQPVKTYSSGMMMRLAFAVNTCVDPDILIVDEALSVGDAPFQAKCFRRLRQLTEKGVSLLFVSHDLGTVRSVCSRALWLKNGHAEMWGDAKAVAKEYEKFCWQEQGVATTGPTPTAAEPLRLVAPPAEITAPLALLQAHNFLLPVADATSRLGNREVEFVSVISTNSRGEPCREFGYNDEMVLHYLLKANRTVDSEYVIGVRLRTVQGNHVLSAQNLEEPMRINLSAGQAAYGRLVLRLPLTHGPYIVRTGIFGFRDGVAHAAGRYDFSRAIFWDIREDALAVTVREHTAMPLAGPVHLHAETTVTSINA